MPPSRGGILYKIKHNKGLLAVSICATLGIIAFTPVYYHMNFVPKFNPNDPLPKSASIRGAYINSGSRDVGPDDTMKKELSKEIK
mmetsp:Transcript_36186/g.80515  ORF Transcript_36186/g.80515 Transcript_36186/m.80515 type:complete len:85 (-) Transcript_36186:100-354(-)